jgi:AbrB family looped-hinge helix DNA binding protein
MAVVEIDDRHRITIPKDIRETLSLSSNQKLYMVAAGDTLIIKKIPQNPSKSLNEILGDTTFDREVRRRAEEWLLGQVRERS